MGKVDAGARPVLLVFAQDMDENRPEVGTAAEEVVVLAKVLTGLDYGYADLAGPPTVYGFDGKGVPVPLEVTVDRPEFDGNDWSDRTVTVTWPDGATVQGCYRIDGRA